MQNDRCRYEIRIRDHLDACWQGWFEGWVITNLENGEALLARDGIDQSGLHGALNKIRDLNLVLVSVNCRARSAYASDNTSDKEKR